MNGGCSRYLVGLSSDVLFCLIVGFHCRFNAVGRVSGCAGVMIWMDCSCCWSRAVGGSGFDFAGAGVSGGHQQQLQQLGDRPLRLFIGFIFIRFFSTRPLLIVIFFFFFFFVQFFLAGANFQRRIPKLCRYNVRNLQKKRKVTRNDSKTGNYSLSRHHN